jgi:LPXTG-motif cell wall-anchored protein
VRTETPDDGDPGEDDEPLPQTGASMGSILAGILIAGAGLTVRRKN